MLCAANIFNLQFSPLVVMRRAATVSIGGCRRWCSFGEGSDPTTRPESLESILGKEEVERRMKEALGLGSAVHPTVAQKASQPTFLTHPHRYFSTHSASNDYLTPGIPHSEYARRRQLLISQMMPGSITILVAADEYIRGADIPHTFRQDSDFYYFTGCSGERGGGGCGNRDDLPMAVFVRHLDEERDGEYHLFVKEKRESDDLWNGPQTGPAMAQSLFMREEPGMKSCAHSSSLSSSALPFLDMLLRTMSIEVVHSGLRRSPLPRLYWKAPLQLRLCGSTSFRYEPLDEVSSYRQLSQLVTSCTDVSSVEAMLNHEHESGVFVGKAKGASSSAGVGDGSAIHRELRTMPYPHPLYLLADFIGAFQVVLLSEGTRTMGYSYGLTASFTSITNPCKGGRKDPKEQLIAASEASFEIVFETGFPRPLVLEKAHEKPLAMLFPTFATGGKPVDGVVSMLPNTCQRYVTIGARSLSVVKDPKMGLTDGIRSVKSPHEVGIQCRSANATAAGFISAMRGTGRASRGVQGPASAHTEEDVLRIFHTASWEAGGSRTLPYTPVVAADTNALSLHYIACTDVLGSTDTSVVSMDAGAEVEGYPTDCTRVWPTSLVGMQNFASGQGSAAMLYKCLLHVQRQLIQTVATSSIGSLQLKATARLRDALCATFPQLDRTRITERLVQSTLLPHPVSHFIGLDLHERMASVPPVDLFLASMSEDEVIPELRHQLQPGMVVTVEPGVYVPVDIPDELKGLPMECRGMGMRIEDMVLVLPGRDTPKLRAWYVLEAYHSWSVHRPDTTMEAFYGEQLLAVYGHTDGLVSLQGGYTEYNVDEWYTLDVLVITASVPKDPTVISAIMQ